MAKKQTMIFKIINIIFIFFSISSYNTLGITIKDILSTYSILSNQYKHLSVAHGAALAESHMIRNYYEFGYLDDRVKGQWLSPGDGPIRLVHALWTFVNNNFVPSSNPGYPGAHIQPSTIARIIIFLENVRSKIKELNAKKLEAIIVQDSSFLSSIESTETKRNNVKSHYTKEIKIKIETLKKATAEEQEKIKSDIKQIKYEQSQELSKLDTSRLFKTLRNEKRKQNIEAELKILEGLKGAEQRKAKSRIRQLKNQLQSLSKTTVTGDCNRLLELAQAIIDSSETSAIYPPHIAHTILLAFLYKKAVDKKDILTYYQTLQKTLGKQIFSDASILETQEWLNAKFNQNNFESTHKQLSSIGKEKCTDASLTDKAYEEFLFAHITDRFYRGTFPKKPEYANVEHKDIIYPDCTETTIRFLCNTLFFNQQKGIFEIPENIIDRINPLISSFYQNNICKQTVSVDLPEVHQQWSKLLVNRPFITYKRMLYYSDNGSPIVLSAPSEIDGFIQLPKEIIEKAKRAKENQKHITIGNHTYILIEDENVELFTVAASLRNIIVALNQLLGLKLYKNKDFLQSDFNQVNFPKIIEYIPILKTVRVDPNKIKMLDERDLSPEGLNLEGENTQLTLLYNHAELTLHEKSKQSPLATSVMQSLLSDKQPSRISQLFNLCAITTTPKDKIPLQLQPPLLFAFNLQNHEEKISTLEKIAQTKTIDQFNPNTQKRIITTIAKIMNALPMRLDWEYQAKCLNAVDGRLLKHPEIFSVIESWKNIGYKRLYKKNLEPDSVPLLFASFVRAGIFCKDGKKIADEALKIAAKTSDMQTRSWFEESTQKLIVELKKRK